MSKREDDAKRRRANASGLLPAKYAEMRALPDGGTLGAHEAGPGALARIAIGGQSAWDVLAAEALAQRCNDLGCAVADGDVGACPGWCAVATAGFEGWVMAS